MELYIQALKPLADFEFRIMMKLRISETALMLINPNTRALFRLDKMYKGIIYSLPSHLYQM